jgi:hypothetical protein
VTSDTISRLTRHGIAAGVLIISACSRPTPAPVPADALPHRLVLALDGVDYRDVQRARAEGRFAAFRAPSRLISTFPSISDVAWHDILDVQPPAGYQRVYFSRALQSVIGRPLDAITPIEYETRMDMAFGGAFHHLGAYLSSDRVARQEIDDAIAGFWRSRSRRTLYVYNVGPDALQHTQGNMTEYLAHLDDGLVRLIDEYRARTGKLLEVVILSDHGHNRATDAYFLPLVDSLAAHGYTVRGRLDEPGDVALSVDGVTTGFGVFTAADSADAVAAVIAALPDIDVVTNVMSDGRIHVRAGGAHAFIEPDPLRATQVRYRPVTGDPLRLVPTIAALRDSGAVDADGYASLDRWARVDLHGRYPAAVQRIVRGHSVITLNPAPILVSVGRGARIGFGFVSVANRLRPLGGTHGALDSTSALGVLMTTFTDTHDAVTSQVRDQLGGFSDLGDVHPAGFSARITTGARLIADPRGPFRASELPADALGPGVMLETNDQSLASDSGVVTIEARRSRRGVPDVTVLSRTAVALTRSQRSVNGRARFIPFARMSLPPLSPDLAVSLRVVIDPSASSNGSSASVVLSTVPVRTDRRGLLVAP